jgi:dolichol-phosphate mannosyltransferase
VLMRAIVIVPTYNERENLPVLIPAILRQGPQFDVLIVDDGSPDGTGQLADAMAAADGRVHVLHRDRKQGLGRAYVAGFKFGLERRYDAMFEMDADLSHNPDDLHRLLDAIEQADVAIGSRWIAGGGTERWSLLRQSISRGGSIYAGQILDMPFADLTSGFKCFRRQVIERLDLDSIRSNGYAFQVEVNYACWLAGFRIREVPIIFPDRIRGESKMNWRIVVEAAVLVPRLRAGLSRVPLVAPPASGFPEPAKRSLA